MYTRMLGEINPLRLPTFMKHDSCGVFDIHDDEWMFFSFLLTAPENWIFFDLGVIVRSLICHHAMCLRWCNNPNPRFISILLLGYLKISVVI